MSGATVRRLSPPDRRAPLSIAAGRCPLGEGCYCCPGAAVVKKHRGCHEPHPPRDRKCAQPYPAKVSWCPERHTLEQFLPYPAPVGYRNPPTPLCIECGRITHRYWIDPEGRELPWCAGLMHTPIKKET